MFQLEWKESAIRELEKLEKSISFRLYKKINSLVNDPFSQDIKKLKGEPAYRLRIGDYRIIFDIEKDKIIILQIAHRSKIYKR